MSAPAAEFAGEIACIARRLRLRSDEIASASEFAEGEERARLQAIGRGLQRSKEPIEWRGRKLDRGDDLYALLVLVRGVAVFDQHWQGRPSVGIFRVSPVRSPFGGEIVAQIERREFGPNVLRSSLGGGFQLVGAWEDPSFDSWRRRYALRTVTRRFTRAQLLARAAASDDWGVRVPAGLHRAERDERRRFGAEMLPYPCEFTALRFAPAAMDGVGREESLRAVAAGCLELESWQDDTMPRNLHRYAFASTILASGRDWAGYPAACRRMSLLAQGALLRRAQRASALVADVVRRAGRARSAERESIIEAAREERAAAFAHLEDLAEEELWSGVREAFGVPVQGAWERAQARSARG